MKDSSSPMDVCPYCGKAFKRLKSHLPHCKMAESKNTAPETDHRDKSMTANLAPIKRTGTTSPVVEKQDPKVKGKKKTEGHKSQVRQEKTISLPRATQPKAGEAASGNTMNQQKAGEATLGNTMNQQKAGEATSGNTMNQQKAREATLGNIVNQQKAGEAASGNTMNQQKAGEAASGNIMNQQKVGEAASGNIMNQQKVGEAASGNKMNRQKAAVTIGRSSEALQKTTRTSLMVTSRKDQDQVALTGLNAPVQQALTLSPKPQRTLPANVDSPQISDTFQILRQQACIGNLEDDRSRSSVQEEILEQDTVESPVKHDTVQGLFHEQVYLDQCSVPRSLSGSTMVFGRSTNFPLERVITQIPGISPTVCNTEASWTNDKSTEIKVDIQSPPKTVLKELPQEVDCSLGLQWVPQLYSNYVQLRVVPGRQDEWDPSKTPDPIARLPELCKTAGKESILENRSTSQHLMDIRLGEIPVWLANRSFELKRFPELMQNAWGRYYNKYINVKKGGVGGLTMLLAGYCVLSYSWNYDHIKQDRWRKYH